ncbi:PREDICTED: methyltransferase 13 [Prunus dulcis]|uniref:PREDICTED: methyltransferase 13 n=1 Tax=Prunus dulcis TaxID=3755 RepID=A0A5E4GAK6_PRUDU|nr:PREDICTED: methyltransferase 13 [Prunus dulcis]
MVVDKTTFETITPSRFITFTFPNPSNSTTLLCVAVLDTPFQLTGSPESPSCSSPNNGSPTGSSPPSPITSNSCSTLPRSPT